MKTYKVSYERDEGGWWIARIASVQGVHSNGRTIAEARRRVREALSLAVDDADVAEFEDDIRLPQGVKLALRRQAEARQRAEAARTAATRAQRDVAKLLVGDVELSLRDAGELLGVTQTMVKKLTTERDAAKKADSRRLFRGVQRTKHVRKARRATASR